MSHPVFAVIFANLVWGLSPVLVKLSLQNIDEMNFLFIRLGFSALFLSSFIIKAIPKMRRLNIWYVFFGVATVSIHYYLQVFALKGVPVSWFVFFYALCPVISLFVTQVQFSIQILMICSLAILGTWMFVDLASSPYISPQSLLALFGSIVTWSVFTAIIRKWQTVLNDTEISAMTSGLSFLVFALIILPQCSFNSNDWTFSTVGPIIVLSLLLPAAFFAHSYSLRKNVQLAVLGQYSEPVFGIFGALVFLREALSPNQVVGVVLMICALVLVFILSKKEVTGT